MSVKVTRDKTTCNGCGRCNHRIHGFSEMDCVRIKDKDFEKEAVQEIVYTLINSCLTDSISFE